MFISIRYKLFATLLAAVVAVVVGMFFLVHWSFGRGFLNYVNTVESRRLDSLVVLLRETYQAEGNWGFLQGNQRLWRQFLVASTPDGPQRLGLPEEMSMSRPENGHRRPYGMGGGMGPRRMRPPEIRQELKHLFEFRVALLDADKSVVEGPRRLPPDVTLIPLEVDSDVRGYLAYFSQKNLLADYQLRFIQQQKKSFAAVSLLIAVLAALLALPLARRLVRKINSLALATHSLAAGKYDARLEVGPSDELGQLTTDFNSLAITLERNEALRRQWVADISHELRTPLSVLRGEIEALQDGVRKPTTETISSLHAEVMRLNRLVDDLFQLSMSDIGALTYRKEVGDIGSLLKNSADLFRQELADRHISLTVEAGEDKDTVIFGDPERLRQLFGNLFSNSLKYTDPGGAVHVNYSGNADRIEILFQDSTPSVEQADLEKLFDRLYRVESSRSRSSGGTGLGLAICRNIVEAHGGSITAEPSSLGGLLIRIVFSVGGNSA